MFSLGKPPIHQTLRGASVEEDGVWTLFQTARDSHSSSTTWKSTVWRSLTSPRKSFLSYPFSAIAREEAPQLPGSWALFAELLHAPSLSLTFLECTRSTSYITLVPALWPSLVLRKGEARDHLDIPRMHKEYIIHNTCPCTPTQLGSRGKEKPGITFRG